MKDMIALDFSELFSIDILIQTKRAGPDVVYPHQLIWAFQTWKSVQQTVIHAGHFELEISVNEHDIVHPEHSVKGTSVEAQEHEIPQVEAEVEHTDLREAERAALPHQRLQSPIHYHIIVLNLLQVDQHGQAHDGVVNVKYDQRSQAQHRQPGPAIHQQRLLSCFDRQN